MVTSAQPTVSDAVPVNGAERLVGERTVPHLWHENYWFRRHEHAYLALSGRVLAALDDGAGDASGTVLEAGCGEGYGAALLEAAGVPRVVGLDYDAATTRHAASAYPTSTVVGGNLARLPLADGCLAAVSCLQVIEHLWTPWEFLAECARVLAPGGVLLLSTPNRPTFSPGLGRDERPPNPFHVREYDAEELVATVAPHLRVEEVLGVTHGPRLAEPAGGHGDVVAAQLATPPQQWPDRLADLVRSVTAADFVLTGATAEALDLVVVARKPAP